MKASLRRLLRVKAILIVGIFLLCSLGSVAPASAQSWTNGYAHRRAMTINYAQVPNTDQMNFPLLVSGTYSYLATMSNGGDVTNSNGYDIIFTSDAAGTSTLPFEKEGYSASTGAVSYWVEIPTLSHTTDTVIYMFYGNSSVTTDQSNAAGVWDTNFKGVWHLPNGITLSSNDSTGNGNNGSLVSSPNAVSGQIGGAAGLNGSSQYIRVASSSSFKPTSGITLSGWVYLTGTTSWSPIFSLDYRADGTWTTPYQSYGLEFYSNLNEPYVNMAINGSYQSVGPSRALSLNIWHYLATTYDGTTIRLFVDGSNVGNTSASGSISYGTSQDLALGQASPYSSCCYLQGNLDELRISATPRSADWIATEYNNQSDPSVFYTMGFADISNGYSFQRAVTIDHTKVASTDQANFPALISGTYSYLATTGNGGSVTNSNGYDIIFTSDAAGMTPLSYERETYNSSTGAINFWVRVPALSHVTDTVIYMFYGNSSVTADQSNPAGVWDTNFKGVWHLPNGTTLTANDSTNNGNNGTIHGSPAAASGQIDGAGTFGASNANYVQASDSASLRIAGTITLSAWLYNTSDNSNGGLIVEKRDATNPGSNYNYGLWLASGGQLLFEFNDGSYRDSYSSTGVVPKNTWTYVVAAFDQSTHLVSFYVNGSLSSTVTTSGTMPAASAGVLQIGNYGTFNGGVYSFDGKLDEIRLSSAVRSADWIATEYTNQNNSSAFFAVGATATPPNLTSLSPTSGPVGTSVTITGTNFGSTQGSSTVTFTGVMAAPTSWSNTQIVVPVPSGAISGSVVVTVSSLASNGLAFTDTSASITQLLPASGPISSSVTILGANFGSSQGTSTVTFNGTAASPTSWSSTQIVVPVPSGASTGNVVVTVASGSTNGAAFTVMSCPLAPRTESYDASLAREPVFLLKNLPG